MSDIQDFSAYRAEESKPVENHEEPMALLPHPAEKQETISTPSANLKEIEESLDAQSYFLGEVPQAHLMDPVAFLPLNSDRLVGSNNRIEKVLEEVSSLIQEEVTLIQKQQKKINLWEDRIEKNKVAIQKNLEQINLNNSGSVYDKKNRDYWTSRAEDVMLDYAHAEVAGREADWAWLIKKYGLKNADGSQIDPRNACVEELCNGEANNLASGYKATANKYEAARKEKETDNCLRIRENAKLATNNELLQGYITAAYTNEIEPLQDGILLLKELGVKMKSLAQETQATYGDLRAWAESFLDAFLKSNPRVTQSIVTEFRRLTSIPLPAEYN